MAVWSYITCTKKLHKPRFNMVSLQFRYGPAHELAFNCLRPPAFCRVCSALLRSCWTYTSSWIKSCEVIWSSNLPTKLIITGILNRHLLGVDFGVILIPAERRISRHVCSSSLKATDCMHETNDTIIRCDPRFNSYGGNYFDVWGTFFDLGCNFKREQWDFYNDND